MNTPNYNLSRFKVASTRKDEPIKEQVERVRTILNESRKEAGYKDLTYMGVFMGLKRKGYNTADKIYSLIENCRDSQNPSKCLNWKVYGK